MWFSVGFPKAERGSGSKGHERMLLEQEVNHS